ncbi:aminotransferase class I/II-fold pyridoxal phosphate-dependent enzyme [Actinomycetota bacterium]
MSYADVTRPDPTSIAGHERLAAFGETIFAEMSALAARTGALNLGQGFPDTDGPAVVLDEAIAQIRGGRNQYSPGMGEPELVAAIVEHQRRWYGLDVSAPGQVMVTAGASEALAAAFLALLKPGDEVVMLEPYYDMYAALTALAGAERRTVPMRFPDFAIDESALRAAFSERTRLVVLNTPHNPTGRVLSREEMELIASLAKEFDALVVTDEVYEHLVFDGLEHIPMATLPGMAERTLTISSGGKTFSVTGWKIGWVTGPAELVRQVRSVKQFLSFVPTAPFQPAIAVGLGMDDAAFDDIATGLQKQRDILVAGLRAAGLTVSVPRAGYFVVADAAPLGAVDALDFCRTTLPETAGVVGVPVSGFCDDPDAARTLVRFAFSKRPEVLEEASRRLQSLGG